MSPDDREDLATLGQRLRFSVASKGLKSVIIQSLGISEKTLERYFRDVTSPSAQQIGSIAELTHLTTDWLIRGINPPKMSQTMTPLGEHADVEMIPRLNVRLSAGIGRVNDPPEGSEMVAISGRLLRRLNIRPEHAHIVEADGDSMEDEIFDKDEVLIDTGLVRPLAEGIYAVVDGDLGMLKRLQPIASLGIIRVISDNPRYEAQTVKMNEPGFQIIGRAKLAMRVL